MIGRARERSSITDFLGQAGAAAAILLVGEAGIGKSTLWESGVADAQARGLRVLLTRPAESESTLAFAGLADLLEPALDDTLPSLPPPQARALEIALQRVAADEPADQLAVHRGVLGVLRAIADASPIVLAIDDVQWLDGSSASAVSFALRRLRDVPILVLASLREPHRDPLDLAGAVPDGVQRVRVGPLDPRTLHTIIEQRLGVVVPPPTMLDVHETSAGNPFYAVELVRAMPVRDGRVVADGLELPGSLLGLVRDRLNALPPPSLAVVAAAGALSDPTTSLLSAFRGGAPQALRPAEVAGIVRLEGERIRFTHPLLASGALALLATSQRQEMHRALAEIVSDDLERARHLALGAAAPHEPDALVLEQAARTAAARGAPNAAGGLAEHAARLTPLDTPSESRRRRRIAAGHYVVAGEVDRGRQLLEELECELPAGPERASVLLLLADTDADIAAAGRRCVQARREAEGDDACLAEAFRLSSEFTMLSGDVPQALELARAASTIGERTGDPVLLVRCLGTQSHYETYQGAITRGLLERAVALEEATPAAGGHYSPTQIMGLRLMYSDRLDDARSLLERIRQRTEDHGDDLERINLLLHLTQLEIRAGNWARARRLADTTQLLDRQVGVQVDSRLFLQALVAAHIGREDEARAAARIALGLGGDQSHALWVLMARWALGLLELSLGNAAAAAECLADLPQLLAESGYRNPGVRPVIPDAVEALVGVGRLGDASRWARELADRGRELDNPWAIATAARCHGLIADAQGDSDGARTSLQAALGAHDRSPNRFECARTLLALGIVERRAKQWRSARTRLTEALEVFDQLGAALWSERTATEIARIQGRRVAGGLTPTEQRVAELVSTGMSNREAAAALHVSVRAIEANLSRVYAKLAIRSRSELAVRMVRDPQRSDGD